VVRSRARRIARAARWVTAFAAAAALLGVGTPALHAQVHPSDVRTDGVRTDSALSAAGLEALLSAAEGMTDPTPHPAVPRGYRAPAAAAAPSAAPAPPPAVSPTPSPAVSSAASRTPEPVPVPQTPAPPAGTGLPLPVQAGGSTQVVTVVASSAGSTRATVTAWQRGPGGWTAVVGPLSARIGRDGVGAASERVWRTPAGTFPLTQAFGRLGNPGTGLPYRVLDSRDWWVSDVTSGLYNQHARCAPATCPFDTSVSEHLVDENPAYNYAVVIDYNMRPVVAGKGSAFFLHVSNGGYTAGCVAISQSGLTAVMRWLDPAADPLIAIGVG
jgi:L,D-peptidoglycan transpeptidase YkuD (ErfK/YbiS/YcfS/YnhG family)